MSAKFLFHVKYYSHSLQRLGCGHFESHYFAYHNGLFFIVKLKTKAIYLLMCSYGVVINGTAVVRKNENYHLIHYISLSSSSPPQSPAPPEDSEMQ